MLPDLSRVIVVGNSASGKSTFGRALAGRMNQSYVELDVLHWLPGWKERPHEEFVRLIEQATAGERWVVVGNYAKTRENTTHWPRATAAIWLNYSFSTNLLRGLCRTIRRSITREEVFPGIHESFRRSFLSRDSVLLWIIGNQRRSRRNLANLRESHRYPQLQWIEFKKLSEADKFLNGLVG